MSSALTRKSLVTLPKNMRLHLGLRPGDAVDFEPLPDGRVAITPAQQQQPKPKVVNPFRKFLGIGIAGLSTEKILREIRGRDSMQ